ncbi:sigma factor-like helix-turn-helix DNA-binding protein [Nocardia farcinica]|uniref:sigma factor-like helix-turn-helix DNA-binding protein n=1 Tax=Nocardia farcinica TaxID=37329 RepID=UPI002455E4C0|nr:sigma factor-like helix-turn-helix DNA-binding protein [Nocardia farcinica]
MSVSLALLTALMRLNPLERAVFVLHAAFGYPHREIAEMLDVSDSAAQQAYHRATQRVRLGRNRFEVSAERARALLERFLAAASTGDVAALRNLLTADATATADGGGVINAARRPVEGADRVARYLLGLFRRQLPGMVIGVEDANGAPALVVRVAGAPMLVVGIDYTEDAIAALRLVVNPAKLAAFGRLSPDPV